MTAATDASDLEFIGAEEFDGSFPGTARGTMGRRLMIVALLCCLPLLYVYGGPEARPGVMYEPLGLHLGDPFAVDWVPLEALSDGPTTYERPLPMAGLDQVCVGFGRLDFPVAERQPTVARCFSSETASRLSDDSAAILDLVAAGNDTWYMVVFGNEVSDVELRLESEAIGRERTYIGGRFAAILVPTGAEPTELRWRIVGGARYESHLRPRQDSNLQSTG